MAAHRPGYPASLDVDYQEQHDRLTSAFRAFTSIPIGIILVLLVGGYKMGGGGLVALPTLLMILFRQKYPRWWFDWNLAVLRFQNRVTAYALLLRDEYPSTEEQQAVHLDVLYPDVSVELNRWLPLVKWFLAIPHYVVLAILGVCLLVVTVIAWFASLLTGRYPRGLFDFVVGVLRWSLRVNAYAFVLATDQYPPFSLD